MNIVGRVKAIFRWPGGFAWMLFATVVFSLVEISLTSQPIFVVPLLLSLAMRIIWIDSVGTWQIEKCQYGRCTSKERKRQNGKHWVIVHGKELLVCNECMRYIRGRRASELTILPQSDDWDT